MNAILAEIAGLAEPVLWTGFFVLLRMGTMVGLLPGIGERALPVRVRLALALALSALVTPLVDLPLQTAGASVVELALIGGKEIVVGGVLGLSVRLVIHGLLVAGVIAAQATSLSQIFGTAVAEGPQAAITLVLYWAGLALFMVSGLPSGIVRAVAESYAFVPIGAGLNVEWGTRWIVGAVAHAFKLGFVLATPFVIAALLYNMAMGVINRAIPQLMVAFVGAPALTAGGLLMLFYAAPPLLAVWLEAIAQTGLDPFGSGP